MNTHPGGWAATPPTQGYVAYRSQSPSYEPVETALDEGVSWKALLRLFLLAFAMYSIVFAISVFLWLFIVLISQTNSSGGTPAFGLLLLGWFVSIVVFWAVLLMTQLSEPISEWKTLLEDRYSIATSSYAAIYGTLRARRTPVAVSARRIRSDVITREVVNNRLVVADGHYVAYVSVFAYGTNLYVGWTMWRNRRGYLLIGHFLKDLLGAMLGRTGIVNQMLRTEKVRAMREAVHAAVREGVEAAIRGYEVPMVSAFGGDVPIENLATSA